MDSYWSRYQRQFSRRRLVQGGAAMAGVALLSAGCGDDDDNTPTATAATGGTTAAGSPTTSATTAPKPQKGGVVRGTSRDFPSTFDVYSTNATTVRNLANSVYSQLWEVKSVPGDSPEYPSQELVPDLALSWEVVDPTTVVAKLNPKAKWTAPISRQFVADDVIYSLDRLLGKVEGVRISSVANQFSMLDSYTATDKQTLTFKLKAPNWLFVWRMADNYLMPIMPPETGKAFDPTTTMVGTGPFMFDKISAPTSWSLKRNPEWHLGPDVPYLDGTENSVVADAATTLSQFKAGNVDSAQVSPGDMSGVASAVKDIQFRGLLAPYYGYLGFSSKDPSAPWNKDVRVRYALSMAIDRDALFEALYTPDQVKAVGLPAPKVLWHGAMPAGLGPAFLDPKGDKMKPESKDHFKYNPDKAKALLAEAGYPDGITADYHYTPFYGTQWNLQCELIPQMTAKAGIKLNSKIDDFTSVYNTKTFLGDFDGIANLYQGFAIVEDYLVAMYDPASGRNQGKINDPHVTDVTNKMLADFDAASRMKTGLEVQQYLVDKMYYVPHIYNAGPNYTAYQPRLRGIEYGTARSGGGFSTAVHTWLAKA